MNEGINILSTTFRLTHSGIKRLHCDILNAFVGVIAKKANGRLVATSDK
jgi:hypothetical protein